LRTWIEPDHTLISVVRQCELLGLPRSSRYYEPRGETPENLSLMRKIDAQYTEWPFLGSRKLALQLGVNRKRVQRLMRMMGIAGIVPRRRTTTPHPGHKKYPYLLRNLEVLRPDQVWCSDITYIPLQHGFLYLVAVMDWFSRYVLSWRLSNTLEGTFCCEALEEALSISRPEIFNTDQGSQFTAVRFTSRLESCGIAISMDGRGRALDNVFIERLWRSVKYEEVYLREYPDGWAAEASLARYFEFYCEGRIHQSLGYRTPASVYHEKGADNRLACSSMRGGEVEKVDEVSKVTSGGA
jgi:putative transposase